MDASNAAGAPLQDIRFAVVLNGGVSLAMWMGGAAHELNELTWARGSFHPILTLINATARADVIFGTSAGGINDGDRAARSSGPWPG